MYYPKTCTVYEKLVKWLLYVFYRQTVKNVQFLHSGGCWGP